MTRPSVAALDGKRCLVLNADYSPLSTYPLSTTPINRAVKKILLGRVDPVADWGYVLRAGGLEIPAPKTVVLRTFARIYADPKFCRRNVLLRDAYRCQYCGHRFESQDLTYDHVVPRADRGTTTWENIVMACVPCNAAKGRHRGTRPLRRPYQPSAAELLHAGFEFIPNDLRESWADWLYWHAPLQA